MTTEIAHKAFKYRLKPTQTQENAFRQAVGAARVAYNMLTALNRDVLRRGWEIRNQLIEQGLSEAEASAQMKKLRKEDLSLKIMSSFAWQKDVLTPEIARHKQAAARIAAGDPIESVWSGERFAEPWFHAVPRRAFVSGADQAATAISNWMKSVAGQRAGNKMGLPRFKKAGRSHDSITIPVVDGSSPAGGYGASYKRGEPRKGFIQDHHRLRLAMFGTVVTYNSTAPLTQLVTQGGTIKSFTISRDAQYWYVSLLVEAPINLLHRPGPTKAQEKAGVIGVDLGVKAKAALSNGEIINNPRHLQLSLKRLAKLQVKLSRTQKGSKNREHLKKQISRLQHKIALQRAASNHQMTKELSTTYVGVGIEDLNVAGMTKSASGTLENPGKNVAAKSGLNRNILDVSFGQIRNQLEYKTKMYGSALTVIGRYEPTSKRCSQCGAMKSDLSLKERTYICVECNYQDDRDINAAKNIRNLAEKELGMVSSISS
ncbi:hypothetical protein E4U03_02445 [Rothia nasimurium]|uniref:Transposase n=1 Tax=Rothia nasimurium TaxID=85336 RepID=A0A4Y9F776_9MICC|nr:RNA-guided endonuclease TnpB family protein [Rothia nasimurium]MBF0807475.1 transposase [Rothia nasimurium]TFU23768.1 hypothetical protein E4U03_02445 [Rothia nasimurium]